MYMPVAALLIEPEGWRLQGLQAFVAAGAIASDSLLYTMTGYGVVSCVTGHHIDDVMLQFFSLATMMLYLLSTSASELLSTYGEVKLFGLLVLLSFGATYVVYTHWFISVWCHFSAVLSAFMLLHFDRILKVPKQASA